MSSQSIADIYEFPFSTHPTLLFDTNVWIMLYDLGRPVPDYRCGVYSEAFEKAQRHKCQLVIDPIIVSELVNVYLNNEMKVYNRMHPEYPIKRVKDFRKTAEYPSVVKVITITVKKIMKQCQLLPPVFELEKILNCGIERFGQHCLDFNDSLIVELCKKNRLTLVTDDGDFRNTDIEILTANPYLLGN